MTPVAEWHGPSLATAAALEARRRAVKQPGVRQQQQQCPPLAPDPRWLAAWSRLVTTRQQLRMHTNLSRGACRDQTGRCLISRR